MTTALAMDASFASGYLAAMIDGEGHVAIQRRGRTIVSRSVIITNTDHGIIEATVEACCALGIRALVRDKHVRPGRRLCKRVVISRRENLERLYEVVALRSEVKAARLAEAVDSYHERQIRREEIPEDTLRALYAAGFNGKQIAAHFGVVSSTAYRWMELVGIERRGRGPCVTA